MDRTEPDLRDVAGVHLEAGEGAADLEARGAPALRHLVVESAQPALVNHIELVLAVVHFVDLTLRELIDEVVDVDEAAADLDEDGLLTVLALGAHLDEDAALAELVDALGHPDRQNLQPVAVELRKVFGDGLIDVIILPANVYLVSGVIRLFLGGLALKREEF